VVEDGETDGGDSVVLASGSRMRRNNGVDVMGKLRDQMEQDLKLRGRSENTRVTYLRCASRSTI
jgi:hypothetical protein